MYSQLLNEYHRYAMKKHEESQLEKACQSLKFQAAYRLHQSIETVLDKTQLSPTR